MRRRCWRHSVKAPSRPASSLAASVGLGRASLYFVRGSGTIVSVDDKADRRVARGRRKRRRTSRSQTGLLFGNTVRDATGLVDGDDFPNSQHFNEISTELNRMVETTVIPPLKERAKVGDAIEFVGCAEVTNVPRDVTPLKVVPLEVKFK